MREGRKKGKRERREREIQRGRWRGGESERKERGREGGREGGRVKEILPKSLSIPSPGPRYIYIATQTIDSVFYLFIIPV